MNVLPKIIKVFFLSIFLLTGFFVFGHSALAVVYRITTDTVWESGVYSVGDQWNGLYIYPGATLTVKPGVIIKMNSGRDIRADGGLKIEGSPTNPVIITSLKDDSVGGDTNGDGSLTSPSTSGDWGGIGTGSPGAKVNISYAKIMYSGSYGGSIYAYRASEFSIDHSSLINNAGRIINEIASFKINYSDIYNIDYCPIKNMLLPDGNYGNVPFCGLTFTNLSTQPIDLSNNFWGDTTGPNPLPYHRYGAIITGPAIINPFLGGQVVLGCMDETASNYDPLATQDNGLCEYKLDPVILVPGILGSWNLLGKWEIDPIFHSFDNLWSALELAGYKKDETLFAFPYNWRLANTYNAMELKKKIDEVKTICNCDRVDIVAHSMGGLVARAYVEFLDYEDDIDQLIFLGTPHRGATMDYLMWEGGEIGSKMPDQVFKRIFQVEAEFNGYGSVFSYIRRLPIKSVEEVLPVYSYLKEKDTLVLRDYPNNYPPNTFLELLNSTLPLARLNSIDVTNIVSETGKNDTINYLKVEHKNSIWGEWEYGYPVGFNNLTGDRGIEYGEGDNTVPKMSNSGFNGFAEINISGTHIDIMTNAQKQIIKELTGIEPVQEIKNNVWENFLMVRIFSPADFKITAPNGEQLGRNIGESGVLNEIKGAFYSGYDNGEEFAIIPNPIDGDYKVELYGTGSGEYTLSVSYIGDTVEEDSNYTASISMGEQKTFILPYNASDNTESIILQPEIKTVDDFIKEIKRLKVTGDIKDQKDVQKILKYTDDFKRELKDCDRDCYDRYRNKNCRNLIEKRNKNIDRILQKIVETAQSIKEHDHLTDYGYNIIVAGVESLKINLKK